MADPTGFRTIGQLAERCGHYCWLEHRLFVVTGSWASAVAAAGAAPVASGPGEAEVRVVCSEMSSWHGFAAAAWRDRLPVRAGVDAGALVVAPAGPLSAALDLLVADGDLLGAFGGLVGQILPALLRAYDEDFVHASPVSEAPVRALLDLVRPRVHQEIERGSEALGHAGAGDGGPAQVAPEGADVRTRLQRVLGGESGIFPAARAS